MCRVHSPINIFRHSPFFFHFFGVLLFYSAHWMSIAIVPILIAERFGPGSEIVIGLGVRLIPQILLAPIVGIVINRVTPSLCAGCAIMINALFFFCIISPVNFLQTQIILAGIGAVESFIFPSFLVIRSSVIPDKGHLNANAILQGAERTAKMLAPIAVGFLAYSFEVTHCVYLTVISFAISGLIIIRKNNQFKKDTFDDQSTYSFNFNGIKANFKIFIKYLFREKITRATIVPAYAYFVTLGIMQPFLFLVLSILRDAQRGMDYFLIRIFSRLHPWRIFRFLTL